MISPHETRGCQQLSATSWSYSQTSIADFAREGQVPIRAEFSNDGKWLVVAWTGGLSVLEVGNREEPREAVFFQTPGQVYDLAISPDSTCVTAPCADGVLRSWDLRAVREERSSNVVLSPISIPARRIAYSRDGSLLATG